MITVRFPNGQAVQYNDAKFVERAQTYSDIYTDKDGKWIAQIPNDCIVESVKPCNIYNPLNQSETSMRYELEALKREIKALRKELKR